MTGNVKNIKKGLSRYSTKLKINHGNDSILCLPNKSSDKAVLHNFEKLYHWNLT